MTNELMPCPFCGGEAVLIQKSSGYVVNPATITNSYIAGCYKCDIFTKAHESKIWQGKDGKVNIEANGATSAIKAWNRRVKE